MWQQCLAHKRCERFYHAINSSTVIRRPIQPVEPKVNEAAFYQIPCVYYRVYGSNLLTLKSCLASSGQHHQSLDWSSFYSSHPYSSERQGSQCREVEGRQVGLIEILVPLYKKYRCKLHNQPSRPSFPFAAAASDIRIKPDDKHWGPESQGKRCGSSQWEGKCGSWSRSYGG